MAPLPSFAFAATTCALAMAVAAADARAAAPGEPGDVGFVDPRARRLPPPHRFRLGLQIDYIRLSQAQDADTGEKQRFHFVPLQLDFAYQFQFLRYAMLRPSLALGGNVGNTMEAMPFILHPQFYAGFQGRIVGAAFGYGYFQPIPAAKDVISAARGGLEQPIIVHNHHIGGEISAMTRVDKGALSFQLRLLGVSSRLQHLDLDKRSWRFMLSFNFGWYFGDGSKQAQWKRRREQRRNGIR